LFSIFDSSSARQSESVGGSRPPFSLLHKPGFFIAPIDKFLQLM
jgi:hypothetical protein